MDLTKEVCLFCQQSFTEKPAVTDQNKQQVNSNNWDEFRENCERFHVHWIDNVNGIDNKELPLCYECKDAYQCMVHLEAEAKQVEQLARKFETCLRERIAAGKNEERGTPGPSILHCSDDGRFTLECNAKGYRLGSTGTAPSVASSPTEVNEECESDASTSSGSLAPFTETPQAIKEPSTSQLESPLPSDLELELEFETDDDDDDPIEDDLEDQGRENGAGDEPAPHIVVLDETPPMYQCNICQKRFRTKAHWKYHRFCATGSDKPFKCDQCGQGFKSRGHFEYHLRLHTGERPFVCQICGKGFIQSAKLTRHMRSHTKEKPFNCLECNRGFASAEGLRAHKMIHEGDRPLACTNCDKRFTIRAHLNKHMIVHASPFSCDQCKMSFKYKSTLDEHSKLHSDERPFPCDQCSRAFTSSRDLRRHLLIHTGEMPFKCGVCQKPFRRKDNLVRHARSAHKE